MSKLAYNITKIVDENKNAMKLQILFCKSQKYVDRNVYHHFGFILSFSINIPQVQ